MWGRCRNVTRVCRTCYLNITCYRSDQASKSSLVTIQDNTTMEESKSKTGDRMKPFINELFTGAFDVNALTFPEALELESVNSLKSRVLMLKSFYKQEVDPRQIDDERQIPESAVEGLCKLGLFGMRAPQEVSGLHLTATEGAQYKEILAQDSSVAELFWVHGDIALECFLWGANPTANEKYLHGLISGKLLATVCLPDEADVVSANVSEDGCWTLNGHCKWVCNATSSGLFLVLAQTSDEKDYNLFAVERNSEGVTVEPPRHMMGSRGLSVSEVKFENTPVPKENILGEVNFGQKLIGDILSSNLYTFGSFGIATLRRLLELSTDFTMQKQLLGKPLQEYGWVLRKVADISCRLYAVESITYLTAGFKDLYKDVDWASESSAVKIFSAECIQKSVDECHEIFGICASNKNSPFEQLVRDAWASTASEDMFTKLRLSIVHAGLEYSGYALPISHRSRFWSKLRRVLMGRDETVLDFYLEEYVHPQLEKPAKQLEYCVSRFHRALETLLEKYGTDIIQFESDLYDLADVVIYIYTMTAVIARASRSYCIGLQDSDYEVLIAAVFCHQALSEVNFAIERILDGSHRTCDSSYSRIVKKILKSKDYFPKGSL